MLKKYDTHHKKVEGKDNTPTPVKRSGIACSEPKCEGEMLIWTPEIEHPELQGSNGEPLKRASCEKCNWRGWV